MTWEAKANILREMYAKGAEDLTIRSRLTLKWMESRGRFVPNCSAQYMNEPVKKGEPTVRARSESSVVIFDRHSIWDKPRQGYRGYIATDSLPWEEYLEFQGEEALVRRYERMLPNLDGALRNNIHEDLYIDGSATGNTTKIEGLDTAMGHTAGSTAADDLVAYPGNTYRGILCTPGQNGSWSTDLSGSNWPCNALESDWPYGKGSAEYDYWAPILPKVDSTSWAKGSSWAENCAEVLRQTGSWLRLLADTTGNELLFCSDGKMNTEFKEYMEAKNRHLMPLPSAVDLGFPEVLSFEGMGVHAEYGIPANTGYVWNFEHAELCFQTPSLFASFGPNWSDTEFAYLCAMAFRGNLVIKPKFFAKLYAFSTS